MDNKNKSRRRKRDKNIPNAFERSHLRIFLMSFARYILNENNKF